MAKLEFLCVCARIKKENVLQNIQKQIKNKTSHKGARKKVYAESFGLAAKTGFFSMGFACRGSCGIVFDNTLEFGTFSDGLGNAYYP